MQSTHPRSNANWDGSQRRKFEEAIRTTIQWYKDNEKWWRSIKSGEYLKYYETQYAER